MAPGWEEPGRARKRGMLGDADGAVGLVAWSSGGAACRCMDVCLVTCLDCGGGVREWTVRGCVGERSVREGDAGWAYSEKGGGGGGMGYLWVLADMSQCTAEELAGLKQASRTPGPGPLRASVPPSRERLSRPRPVTTRQARRYLSRSRDDSCPLDMRREDACIRCHITYKAAL